MKVKIISTNLVLIALLFMLYQPVIKSQCNFYIPLNVKDAYKKNTRSYDGKPGKNYWQNSSDYKIKASINPETRLLTGSESIVYHNDSPDTLKKLVFRIYQDLNKYGAARNFEMNKEAIGPGVDIKKLLIENNEIDILNKKIAVREKTNLTVKLEKPLVPGSKINLSFEWSFTIPEGGNVRMGTYDSTSFMIAYWYPQVSVYDDIDGWDTFNYNGEQEFYNDFSNYDVEITVPNNFAVWATGQLENASAVLLPNYLTLYNKAKESDTVVNIVKKEDILKGNIYNNSSSTNTWHYTAQNVTDFAFATSDHYLWDAVSLVVDKQNGRRTYIAAVYKEQSKDFYGVADIARKSIEYYSYELPGVSFPFPSLTVFNGGTGGMEFPMMVNDGSADTEARTVGVTSHEIAHQYFPFYMGINERKYAWMDEGMATMIPFDFQTRSVEGNDPRAKNVLEYEAFAGTEMDMPLTTPSVLLTGKSYRIASYRRPGLAYDFLRDALGKEVFDKTFRGYIALWNGRHPLPYDFFYTFNKLTGKNLNWFWLPWFFEKGYPDLALKNVKINGNKVSVVVEKLGSIPVPVELKFYLKDKSETIEYKTAAVWENGTGELSIEKELSAPLERIELGSKRIPDVDKSNNIFVNSK